MEQTHDPADPRRRVRQPGPELAPRAVVVPAAGRDVAFTLTPGTPLLEAIAVPLRAAGFTSAALALDGGAFGPFAFVIPALSETPDHAAFYSAPFVPAGQSPLETVRVTFGTRDGAPWLHAHGFWTADGVRAGGHVLPQETVVAAPIVARGWALEGAGFVARHDPETHFALLAPEPQPPARSGPALAVRLRPNQDICHALETICREHAIAHAEIHGGVLSLIGAQFEDGALVANFATEIFIRSGRIAPGAHGPEATLDIALVDYTGALAEGRLRRGANPVLMTAELVIVPI